ncbi:MAG TPA: RNA-binding protein [Polyangiaceae bacterium]|nr:RNA-binding protein [Polyangiaceae bacterium]
MNNRLYVGNLSFHTTEDTLQRAFAQCGDVVEAKLVLDRETGRSRGFAFVVMATAEDAQRAISQMDGTDLDGRALRVNEAEARKPRGGGFGGGGGGGGGFGGGGGGGGRGGDRGGDRGFRGGGGSERRNRW